MARSSMLKTQVVITLQVEALHRWPNAEKVLPEVGFLSHPHRHMFHIKMYKLVQHNDRDVEFIKWKRDVNQFLNTRYGNPLMEGGCLSFGHMSCEHIATMLLQTYDCSRVEVWEDGENGAIVEVDPTMLEAKANYFPETPGLKIHDDE